jgi:hypothetical protein
LGISIIRTRLTIKRVSNAEIQARNRKNPPCAKNELAVIQVFLRIW